MLELVPAGLSNPPSVNTDMSMPEEKCLPSAEMTSTRAEASLDRVFTAAGSSVQKDGIIEFAFSGRFNRMWAMPLATSSSKHS